MSSVLNVQISALKQNGLLQTLAAGGNGLQPAGNAQPLLCFILFPYEFMHFLETKWVLKEVHAEVIISCLEEAQTSEGLSSNYKCVK